MQSVRAGARYGRAIAAVADLLARLKVDFIFVGSVARSAWLGSRVERGSLELIALLGPEQKNQVAMMANNRGFRVDRQEIERSEELDLIPLGFVDPEGEVRVHVLVSSNALYGRMVAGGRHVILSREDGEGSRTDGPGRGLSERDSSPSSRLGMTAEVKVASAEDLALLLALADDEQSQRAMQMLVGLPEFDRPSYNRRLVSIGLPQMVVAE